MEPAEEPAFDAGQSNRVTEPGEAEVTMLRLGKPLAVPDERIRLSLTANMLGRDLVSAITGAEPPGNGC